MLTYTNKTEQQMNKQQLIETQVTDMVCKALFDLESKLVTKFNIDSFDAYIDGEKYNKVVDKLIKMYTTTAIAEVEATK
jgi:hypothetical protein